MNEAVTMTPFYYFMMEFAKFVYAIFPIIMVFVGVSFIIQSINTEPWGTSVYPLGIYTGILLTIFGFILLVVL